MDNTPVLYCGLDIGIRKDTAALVAVYENHETQEFIEWGHKIWEPPVRITEQIDPFLFQMFSTNRVAALAFDWYQFQATLEKLQEAGYTNRLIEVNQMTENPAFTGLLHTLFWDGRFAMIDDPDARNHLAWTATRETERGARIEKRKQSKPVDYTVSLGMALLATSRDLGYIHHPTFASTTHTRSATMLP